MIYLLNTYLNNNKKVSTALSSLYGINKKLSFQICADLGIGEDIRIKQLKSSLINSLTQFIYQNFITGAELKRLIRRDIRRLVDISSYRGFRHIRGLPVRGQRTHGNARTSRKFVFGVSK